MWRVLESWPYIEIGTLSRGIGVHLLTIVPITGPRPSPTIGVGPAAMLLAPQPLALIGAAIGPRELSQARLLVVLVLALLSAPVWPDHAAFAAHPTQTPLADIDTIISKDVLPVAIHGV